jgi:hypothetical protein
MSQRSPESPAPRRRVRGLLSLSYPQVQDPSHTLWVVRHLPIDLSGLPATRPEHPSRDG